MGGSVRNKQLLRIAGIVSVILLIAYLYFSWQSDVKTYKDKLATSKVEYQDLLTKFNKLTDELKRNVQRAAETRHELEKTKKAHQVETTKKDDQVKRCMDELREYKTQLQKMETHRDRVQSDKEQLEQNKQTVDAELNRLSNELDELKLSSVRDHEAAQTCLSNLEGVKAQLLSAQTDSLGASQKTQECQVQLLAATDTYEACQKKVDSLEAENYNKNTEIQQLQAQANLLKQQQQQQIDRKQSLPLRDSIKKPLPEEGFKDINVMDSQKQKTLAALKEKVKNRIVLSEQEQHALQMLTKPNGVNSHSQIPEKRKISLRQTNANDGAKKDTGNQHPPPLPPGNSPELNHAEEEQVEDLVDEKNKKDTLENLDTKEDIDIEGGADGGDDGEDQQEGKEYNAHNEQEEGNYDSRMEQERNYGDKEERNHNEQREGEEGKPLPDPVGKDLENEMDFPDNRDDDMDDPDGHEAFKKDQEHFRKEFHGRKRQDIKKGPGHNEVR